MSEPVRTTVEDGIAVIEIDNPPVNALSQAVRQGLVEAVQAADADPAINAIMIYGAGRTFIAGADIREFGKPPLPPSLPDVINDIEDVSTPTVCALHGTALGGGLETALGTHYRVALASARFGLPEVNLGILPGAGGTQRLPRIVPIAKAVKMITGGGMIGAKEALELGLIDEIVEGDDVRAAGVAMAKRLVAEGASARPTSARAANTVSAEDFAQMMAMVSKKARGLKAPINCMKAIEAAMTLPFEEGMTRERELFTELFTDPQSPAMIHAFFSEREVAKIPEMKTGTPRDIRKVGVVGGGTMGAGIATSALLAGLDVTLAERDTEAAEKAAATVSSHLAGAVKVGKLAQAKYDAIMGGAFRTTTDYGDFADADLVIEAVFESMEVKKDVFGQLDKICKPGAILASNTSYLNVDDIAAMTSRPQDVIGLHFFSPAHMMRLLEVVVGAKTSPDVVASGFALGKRMKKIAVRSGVCDGFIGNRILNAYARAINGAVLAGASPYDVDRAMQEFGLAMGLFRVADLAGLDIGWANRKRMAETRDPREQYSEFADRICELGRFGRKTGRGFYIHDKDKGELPDDEVLAIIANERADKGIAARDISDQEIIDRYMAAMINEAAKIVGEGIALRPLDVDITLLNGYGFPRWRGGPMHYADAVGLEKILNDIKTFAEEDDYFWQPAPLLEQLVAEGKTFASLNR
ncbi:3-hydroxyacyl-CoA dehydrogenase NAD-binding domain-containing protein [uncultured Shimia sp.]|uniref:3-hydroxyacyl-CoA dehydrogenase NAD-binding domain-containing protein n=1 Tax=uncultured Shimia sp. TaxID=573152 RepID=UPI002638FD1F|nr:3-hydroxyacyl-CoA dehydrogenase NAD-binding domain-containing protein [uncultured Shimia sp.]